MKKVLFVLLFLSVFICRSQNFTADRPGVGYRVGVIPIYKFQVETGYKR